MQDTRGGGAVVEGTGFNVSRLDYTDGKEKRWHSSSNSNSSRQYMLERATRCLATMSERLVAPPALYLNPTYNITSTAPLTPTPLLSSR